MEELIDLIATDSAPSEISNKIKDLLFAKASEKIEEFMYNNKDMIKIK